MLEPQKVLDGSYNALGKLGTNGFWGKSLLDFANSMGLLVLAVFLSVSFFLFWVLLLFFLQIDTTVIGIFLFVNLLLLISFSVFSFYNITSSSETFSTQLLEVCMTCANRGFWIFLGVSFLLLSVVFLLCVFLIFCSKHLCPTRLAKDWLGIVERSTKMIKGGINKIFMVKLILLVPAFFSLHLKLNVLLLTIFSSILLASPSTKEFRVVGSCPEELCISNQTQTFFQEGDLCVPDHFR